MATKELLVLTVHGMGETDQNYWKGLHSSLSKLINQATWKRIHFEPIYYQHIVQDNQYDVWTRMLLDHKLDWQTLRRFMLFAFSDAATLEHHSNRPDSPYLAAQRAIRHTIRKGLAAVASPAAPVAIIAQSLGCQVISNYIWDSQKDSGIWQHEPLPGLPANEEQFLRLGTAALMLTTGCNIPFFVSGLKKIEPFAKPTKDFRWFNYFDRDDILGWPLQPLGPEYKKIITKDVAINSGGLLTGWNPASHTGYWTDRDFTKPAAGHLAALLK
jgi:hypothetical protein